MTHDLSREARREEIRNNIVREREGTGVGAIAGIIIALILAVGLVAWALSGNHNVARNDALNPPTTTGQSTPAPAPTVAPERIPAPAPKAQ